MKKGLEVLIRNNPKATVKEIEYFLSSLEELGDIDCKVDINNLFKVYITDNTSDKWIFFGLVNYTIQLNAREMLIIAHTLTFHKFTVSNLRQYNIDINDVIRFMHHIYTVYANALPNDELAWEKFEYQYVGGCILESVIRYSNEILNLYEKNFTLSKEEITEYYSGLFDVMKQQDFDKVKLYIDYTLS